MADRLVNELTGEELGIDDYLRANRAIERQIFRIDNVNAELKSTLKANKEEREKLIASLRSNAREIRLLGAASRRQSKARKQEKES
jgi:hypothetical protein